jgi:RNA polymerase sigma-70 factor (ECF subfamily)
MRTPTPTRQLSAEAAPSADLSCWTEEQLLSSAQQGNCEALDELLARHRSMVFAVLLRYTGSRDEAEDLVQDVMLRACQNIARFRGQSRFSSWLVAIGINAAISARRKNGSAQWVYLDEVPEAGDHTPMLVLIDHRHTPEQTYLNKERHELLQRKLRRLGPKYRSVFEWTDIDGRSIHTTARTLGITPNAVKSRLHRARRMLSDSLKPYAAGPRRGAGLMKRAIGETADAAASGIPTAFAMNVVPVISNDSHIRR